MSRSDEQIPHSWLPLSCLMDNKMCSTVELCEAIVSVAEGGEVNCSKK